LLWLTRKGLVLGSLDLPGWSSVLPHGGFVDDGTVAIVIALIMFVVPSRSEPGQRLLDWSATRDLPWGIVLLFGGGFALAHGFVDSGLTDWLGVRLQGLSVLPPVLLVLSICLIITFLTELTSNTATTQMALPVLASVAAAVGVNPLLLMVPATFSASCAFMLPVATPPNAIVFGTDMLTVREMARTGVLLNLFGAVVITVVVWLLGGVAFGVPMDQVPVWAVN
jgi:sodium-dependent dicarboxylate transporter 2/3/5